MLGTASEEIAPLLGRATEQGLLASLLNEVTTRGQPLVLRGEPGIGKSRLLSEAARIARERGMAVLTATGVQSEAHLPFAGLHQMLRPVRERVAELPGVQREALDAAFGLSDEVAPEPHRIAMAALDLVSEVAAEHPVLPVVDDAQWLDRPTADVLAFVARRIESDPVLLLAAARAATDGRTRRRDNHRSTGQPSDLRFPARCRGHPDHPGGTVNAGGELRRLSSCPTGTGSGGSRGRAAFWSWGR